MQKVIPGSPVRVVETTVQDNNLNSKKTNIFQRLINKLKKIFGGNK